MSPIITTPLLTFATRHYDSNNGYISWIIHNAEENHNFLRGKPHEWLIREIVREIKGSDPLFRELRTLGARTAPNAAVRVNGYFNRH